MRKLLLLGVLLISQVNFAQYQFRFLDLEYFTLSTSIDPTSSIKEKGLDIVGEGEVVAGFFYAKLGAESFSVLTGGYKDVHAGLGLNFTSGYFNEVRYYAGIRSAVVFRDSGFRWNPGLEAGIDYNLGNNYFVGLRSTLDKRYDQEILGWKPELKFSGFVRLGYKWDYHPRR